jgi:hypothetical protein
MACFAEIGAELVCVFNLLTAAPVDRSKPMPGA